MLSQFIVLIISFAAVTLGSASQGLSGFGIAIIAAPILVLIDPNYLPSPILMLGFTLSLLSVIRYRHQVNFKRIQLALYGRVPGTLIGVILLALLPQSWLSLSFALLIIVSLILSYRHIAIHQTSMNLWLAGFFSGVMGTTTSVGSPPMALAYQNSEVQTARIDLGLYFLVGTFISIVFLSISGHFSQQQLLLTLPLLPAVVLGFILSLLLDKYFHNKHFKPLVALLSFIASLTIIVKNL